MKNQCKDCVYHNTVDDGCYVPGRMTPEGPAPLMTDVVCTKRHTLESTFDVVCTELRQAMSFVDQCKGCTYYNESSDLCYAPDRYGEESPKMTMQECNMKQEISTPLVTSPGMLISPVFWCAPFKFKKPCMEKETKESSRDFNSLPSECLEAMTKILTFGA